MVGIALVSLLLLWISFTAQIGAQWSFYEQYNYGWAVPFLCVYLLWQRWPDRPLIQPPPAHPPSLHWLTGSLTYRLSGPALCLALIPIRLIHEPNPHWRLSTWAWAILLVTITLVLLWRAAGAGWVRHFGPAIAFFLVSVPWPSTIEAPLVQGLMRLNVGITSELLHWTGVPVIQRGNVLELSTGLLNVEEACSGIRSLQAAIMLSLLFALHYRLNLSRTIALSLLAPVLTFIFNLLRTFVLSSVAAHSSVQAVAAWHDPASITILVACFLSLWLLAVLIRRYWSMSPGHGPASHPSHFPERECVRRTTRSTSTRPNASSLPPAPRPLTPDSRPLPPILSPSPVHSPQSIVHSPGIAPVLLATLLLTEVGVRLWYYAIETRQPPATHWTIATPTNQPSFAFVEFPAKTKPILRYDEAANCAWTDPDGVRFQMIYLRWRPGHIAGHLAKLHTPDICLTGVGMQLTPLPGIRQMETSAVKLRFRLFRVNSDDRSGFVFYTRYGAGGVSMLEEEPEFDRFQRLRAVLKGRGAQGVQVLEIALWGTIDEQQALSSLQSQLPHLITTPAS